MGLLSSGLNPLQALWFQFLEYLPQLIAAAIIFIVGWIIAPVLGRLATRLVRFTGVDDWIDQMDVNERLRIRADSRYTILSSMVGLLIRWLVVLAVIGVAADAINLPQVSEFIGAVFAYIPNVLAAVVILAIGFVGAQYAADFVATGIDVSRFPVANRQAVAAVAKYSIIIFTIMAALTQLRIVPDLI
ncbi:MAG TPA: hypothetical protein VNM40_00545 [Candidatus Paceibacterota bacterium]|nr:hypothetical protein [Candidatus Paceibacterota bacterium]